MFDFVRVGETFSGLLAQACLTALFAVLAAWAAWLLGMTGISKCGVVWERDLDGMTRQIQEE